MIQVILAAIAAVGEPSALMVVSPRALKPALTEFVRFKSERLPTELVDLEDAIAGPGADDPEKLKKYLYARWLAGRGSPKDGARPPLGYVLLVGDADIMPVRYMVLDRNTDAAFNYAFYPSDLYYADLAKPDGSFEDWNGTKGDPAKPEEAFHAGYFGEVRGEHFKNDPMNYDHIDYKPEIGVGRWPVSTPAQAAVVAAKTVVYERGLAGLKGRRVGLVASGGWIENRPAMDAIATTLGGGWKAQRFFWGHESGEGALPPPDEAHIVELLNSGVQFVLHSGHGSDTSWHAAISTGTIPKFHNEATPAIMMSAGCSTARLATLPPYEPYIDFEGHEHTGTDHGEVFAAPPPPPAPYQTGKYNTGGLGEELLRAGPTGAVAYIGCNTGSQPCGMTLMAGLADAIARRQSQPGPVRLGDCWKDAETYYFDHEHLATLAPSPDWYPASIFFQGMKFMLYGDPSIPIPAPVDAR
jgi:hypothetical protein